jgi:glycosyl transferase family 2
MNAGDRAQPVERLARRKDVRVVPCPLVSVVITCYNYGALLHGSITSALAQSHPAIQVIVVDDGSTDDSRAVAASYGDAVVPVFKPHGGQGSAFNAGFAASRGDVVCFLDADDTLLPEAARVAADRFREPGVAKVHWPLWTVDEQGRRLGSLQPPEPLGEGDLLAAVLSGGPMGYVWPVTTGNAWARSFLERVMPMPEPEFQGAAESYLATLAPAFGVVRSVAEPLGTYRVHPESVSNRRLVTDSMRNTERQYRALHDAFAKAGHVAALPAWTPTPEFRTEVIATCEELAAVLPPGAVFGFVEWNQWGPGEILAGRRSLPFPARDGRYAGRPLDDAAAIGELERLRAAGATHIVFASPALWWLEYYQGFASHLASRFRRTAASERVIVFDIRA